MSFLDFREPVSAWTHFTWLLLSLPATLYLWRRSRGDRPKQVSLLIFGFGLASCYAGSTLFHAVRLPQDWIEFWEAVDCTGIYLLIAGTCTPIAFNLLDGRWRWGMLGLAWVLAVVGISLRLLYWNVPPWVYTGLYLGIGWSLVISYAELARVVSHRSMALVVLGGLLYTIGAAINVAKWPVFWPGVFGAHELFHVFAMAGSVVHYWFMLTVVVPYECGAAVPATAEDFDNSLAPGRIGG